ncbi:MAG: exodeoxyribonuclease VII large subunit [Oligoflexia bacterium]|nr:exodeoxyribonuclease VII large subunit [Oligoflexia bacterium]
MRNATPSVAQVIGKVKNLIEGSFRNISVAGEVTNLSRSATGHVYFTLSDSQAALSCALFKMDAFRNPAIKNIKDGDKVICSGPIGVYAKRGTFQLVVKSIAPVGKGDLKEQFEILKKRLAGEGLFDIDHKVSIPTLPKRIAVITAEHGAALQDFLQVTSRRSLWMDVVVIPALVQGDRAPESIRHALTKAIKYHLQATEDKKFDVIVLTRGGGSLEDLWAFNDEALAWDIYNCPIPIISAVGHEVDFSISDMVADLRCETPSAAAEILSNTQNTLLSKLESNKKILSYYGDSILGEMREKVAPLSPEKLLGIFYQRLGELKDRLGECRLDNRLVELTGYHEKLMRLEDCSTQLKDSLPKRLKELSDKLERNNHVLKVLDPNNVLERGYSYVRTKEGQNVISNQKDFNNLTENDKLEIHFRDGKGEVRPCRQ